MSKKVDDIDISGIDYLDTKSAKKLSSLNDSDFESMEQDNYDDSKENIEIQNRVNENNRKSMLANGGTPNSNKKIKNNHISPHKSRKWRKFSKIKLTRENLRKYLATNDENSFICGTSSSNYIAFNTSLDVLTEQLHLAPRCDPTVALNEDCNDSLCEFTFTHPNKTKTSEASIKNLSQLSVSKFLQFTTF